MLVHALYLSAIRFALSLFPTLLMGSRLRRSNSTLSMLLLVVIILLGNLIALFSFGQFLEIFGLSFFAFLFGVFWIIRLPDWNVHGQVTWSMTLMTTALFILYTLLLTAFSP